MIRNTILTAAIIAAGFYSSLAKADNVNKYTQSLSVQFGINGNLQDTKSYGLAFVPPDFSYSRELYDDDFFNISAAAYYDNIGVKVRDTDFSYRVGGRIDAGLELGKYTPYLTLGLGTIRNGHTYQTSPVYGTGFLVRVAQRVLWVNEINFQRVHYQNSHYEILNLSTGFVYAF